jgi:methylase of polypeptide subunit release factors
MLDTNPADTQPHLHWHESDTPHSARWQSASGVPVPKKVMAVDDTLNADTAYKQACDGVALLWRGDFHQGRQMVQALARRLDKARAQKAAKASHKNALDTITAREQFYAHRQAQAQRARVLGLVVVQLAGDYSLALRRAPDLREACTQAWGQPDGADRVVSLRELMGVVAAFEWRKKGVEIAALVGAGDGRIYPHYGVFSPVRGEYVALVAQAAQQRRATLPFVTAFDIGVGTGVLSAVLVRGGAQQVVATDQDARAIACAHDNIVRLGLAQRVQLLHTDIFPPGAADVIVCNPPWLPGRPSSALEHAVYDLDSRMLRGFLNGLRAHLAAQGEGWLILSDLAEHLGLRQPGELAGLIQQAGLQVLGTLEATPTHPKAQDASEPLHAARAQEMTRLWRLAAA